MQKQTSWTPRIMPWSARSYFAVPMGHKIYFHTPDTRLPVQQTVHNNNNNLTSIVTAIYSHSHCCICRREFVIVLNQLHVYSLSGLVWWLNVLIWKLLSKSSLFKSQGIRGVQFSLWILSAEMSITATERRVVWSESKTPHDVCGAVVDNHCPLVISTTLHAVLASSIAAAVGHAKHTGLHVPVAFGCVRMASV